MFVQRLLFAFALLLAASYTWLRGGFVWVDAWSLHTAFSRNGEGMPATPGLAKATFAAGCFWSVESDFDKVPGVVATTAGYTGGHVANPSYSQVSSGGTGHVEAVEIVFDPEVVSYDQLLDHYWHNVDPFVAHRQFCDVGEQYRPAIFVHDRRQREAAVRSKALAEARLRRPVVVTVSEAAAFYVAEGYHQDYHNRHPWQYRYYRAGCGRDRRLNEIWAGLPVDTSMETWTGPGTTMMSDVSR